MNNPANNDFSSSLMELQQDAAGNFAGRFDMPVPSMGRFYISCLMIVWLDG